MASVLSGKSTFMDLICGKTKADSGKVLFQNADILGKKEVEIAQMGIGRKFQKPTVFANHSVFENLDDLTGRNPAFTGPDLDDLTDFKCVHCRSRFVFCVRVRLMQQILETRSTRASPNTLEKPEIF